MRVLIAADTYYPHVNGASYFAQRLAFYLKKHGHSVLVIAPSRTIHSGFFSNDGIDIYGVRSFPILMYKGFRFVPPFFVEEELEKVIRDFNPDVVHTQSHFFVGKSVCGIAKKLGLPTMGTNHFMPENLVHYAHLPASLENKLKQWAWKKFREVFDHLEVVTTPTRTAADLLKKNGFGKEVIVISCGIDLKKFGPHNNGDYLKEAYKIPAKPTLLYVGRLDKEKNVDLVLRALALVTKKIDVQFVIAGIGAEKKNLKNLAKNLGLEKLTFFTGFVADGDLPNLYRVADAFINAGIAELQSIVTMEAMATGLPILAVKAMALPELCHDGENGYLFKPDDANGLAECIFNLFSNPERKAEMAKKSLEIIADHDIDKTIGRFVSIYEKLRKK